MRHDDYRIAGLPDLVWGSKVRSPEMTCPACGSHDIYYSGTPSDPEEILGESVRCRTCGWLTDYYEAYKHGEVILSYMKEHER